MKRQMEYKEHGAGCGLQRKWDIDDVISEYDQNWDITLQELARCSGWTVKELKKLLMGG
jgi:uncharacterized protein YbgA (DUF1722 family)